MSSGITFSNFNNIDWNSILNAVMTQERAPIAALQTRQSSMTSRSAAFAQLATRVAALDDALEALGTASSLTARTATNSNPSAATLATTGSTSAGTYDVEVVELARAQVTAAVTLFDDKDTQLVATAGTLDIGSRHVDLAGLTLEKLAARINTTDGIGVVASIVSPQAGKYKLVLTGTTTGDAGAFTPVITGASGGNGLAFAGNTIDAHDAEVIVNGEHSFSTTNTIDGVIPGGTLTLLKKSESTTMTVTVDQAATRTALKTLVRSYNELRKFVSTQASVTSGDDGKIGHDALLTALNAELHNGLLKTAASGAVRGVIDLGVGFERSGDLSFSETKFNEIAADPDTVKALFVGTAEAPGIFAALHKDIARYTNSGGLISETRDRIDAEAKAIGNRIDDMNDRLEIRRQALQKEYAAADRAMTSLNSQMSALSSIGSEYRLF
jgi:flagellar hook-associated protein 2